MLAGACEMISVTCVGDLNVKCESCGVPDLLSPPGTGQADDRREVLVTNGQRRPAVRSPSAMMHDRGAAPGWLGDVLEPLCWGPGPSRPTDQPGELG